MLANGCQGEPDATATVYELAFTPDVTTGEQYSCFGFPTDEIPSRPIQEIALQATLQGGVTLHHVALYAVQGGYGAGPVDCELMPEGAVELDVWAPGGQPLALPDDVGLAVPSGSTLVVQAHALRTGPEPAVQSTLRLRFTSDEPAHLAAWLSARAPVPAIRPHHTEVSVAECRPAGTLHLLSTWPHMHQVGSAFHGAIVRGDGSREALVDVEPWGFADQHAYPVEVTLAQGDAIETRCEWRNDGDAYVLPGPRTVDEMCGQSLVVWPAEQARCSP